MPAVGIAQSLRDVVIFGKEDRRIRAVHRVLKEEPVHRLQKTLRLLPRHGKLAAQVGLQVGHQQRGSNSLARDIADEQPDLVFSQSEKIVVVAAHMAGLHARARIIQRPQRRETSAETASPAPVSQFPVPAPGAVPTPAAPPARGAAPRSPGSSHRSPAGQRSFHPHRKRPPTCRPTTAAAEDEETAPRGSAKDRTSQRYLRR